MRISEECVWCVRGGQELLLMFSDAAAPPAGESVDHNKVVNKNVQYPCILELNDMV